VAETLFADLAAGSDDAAIRVNPVIDRNFSVDPTVSAGGQVIDTVLEVWLPEGIDDAIAQRVLTESPQIGIVGAFRVDEAILKST
jgi:hypothetical protein